MIFVFQYVLSRKKRHRQLLLLEITEGTYMNTDTTVEIDV